MSFDEQRFFCLNIVQITDFFFFFTLWTLPGMGVEALEMDNSPCHC